MSLAAPLARRAFEGLSRLRGARFFHPEGACFEATLEPGAEGGPGVFSTPERRDALVRFSRGAGLPDAVPDVLGLAIRVPDAYGGGRHQDLLLVTSGPAPVARHAILPGPRGFFRHTYSSVAPFRGAAGLNMIGVRCADSGPSPATVKELFSVAPGRAFDVLTASLTGPWRRVARLEIGAALAADEAERLRFNPWNTSDELQPAGPLMRLRDPAYRGSQEGYRGGSG